MKIKPTTEVPAQEMTQDCQGVTMRWLLGSDDGAPNFAMRHFEVAPGGYTPRHQHPWEHEVYILGGAGVLVDPEGVERPLGAGDSVFVPGDELHQFRNTGDAPLQFLCMVPHPDRACGPEDDNCCNGQPEKCRPTQMGYK